MIPYSEVKGLALIEKIGLNPTWEAVGLQLVIALAAVLVSHLLRISLILADERGHGPIDVSIVNTATALLHLDPTTPAALPPIKPRAERGPRSRG